jgi:hypothetical protein
MGTLTSTLAIRLQDDVSGRAAKAAGALKQLGGAGKGLGQIGGSTAGLDRLAQRLDALRGKLERLSAFRAAGRGLIDLSGDLRKARDDLSAAEALLKKRQATVNHFAKIKASDPNRYAKWMADGLVAQVNDNLRAAKTAQAQADRAAKAAQKAYDGQRATVSSLRAEVLPAGVPTSRLVGQDARLRALIARTEAEQRAQAAARAEAARAATMPAQRSAAEIEALLPRNLGKTAGTATAAAEGLGKVEAKATGATAALKQAAVVVPPFTGFSDALTRDLAALDLTKAELRTLARDVTRMRTDQVKALGPINPKYHAQILDADRGSIEDKVRNRAREMHEERRTAALLAGGPKAEAKPVEPAGSVTFDPDALRDMRKRMSLTTRLGRQQASEEAAAAAAEQKSLRDRLAFASRMARQRAQEERRAGLETVRAAREAAREKLQAAREAAREARRLEREGAREAAQAARQAAQAARQAARERVQAAREAARGVREAARQEAAALRQLSRERARASREAARAARENRRVGREVGSGARMAAGAIGAGGAVYGTERLVRRGAENAGRREMETARGRAVGLTPEEDKLGQDRANELSRQFPSLDPTELRELYRALHVNLGGNAKAASETLDPVARSQVLLQNFRTRQDAQFDLARIIRGAENMGISDDPKKFQVYLEGATKGMQLFGDTLRGEDYYQYAKTGRLAVAGLSPRFLGAIAPSIIDDMGGPSAGQAHYTAYNAVVAGRMKKSSKAVAAEYGLMGKDGRMIGRDTFQRDPFEWALKVLEPALAKKGKGIKDGDTSAFVDTLATIFNDRNAAEFIGKLVTKQGELKRNEERFNQVRGLEDAEKVRRENPAVALEAAKTQGAGLLGEALTPAIQPAIVALNGLADAAAGASAKLRDNPEAVQAGGAAATILGAVLGPQVAGALMKKLAGDGTGILANALRMGGSAAQAVGGALGYGASVGVPTAVGAAANEAEGINEQGIPNLIAGRELPTARVARLLVEARRAQATVSGRRDEIEERIAGMRRQIESTTKHYGEAPEGRVGEDLARRRARLGEMEAERDALNESLREASRGRALGQPGLTRDPTVTTPAPPQRPTVTTPAPPERPAGLGAAPAPAPAPAPAAPAAPAPAAPVDTGAISRATEELARYRAELAEIQARQMATASLGLPGLGQGLAAKRAELEGLISSLEARLQALNGLSIAPSVEGAPLDALGVQADGAREKLAAVGGMSVAPTVDVSGINAAVAAAEKLLATLGRIPGATAAASAGVGRLAAAGAGAGGSGGASGARGSTPPPSSGAVRRGLGNNFA